MLNILGIDKVFVKLVKVGRKWKIEGHGEGWIYDRTFPSKYKAEIAARVFEIGGRTSDYWKECREYMKSQNTRIPHRAIEQVEKAYDEIEELDPTCDEIEEYGENAGYGVDVLVLSKYKPVPVSFDT